MRILFMVAGAQSAELPVLWTHEQKESLEEAVLRMGSEQIRRRDMRILFMVAGAQSAELPVLWAHEQKILRMGSEQMWI